MLVILQSPIFNIKREIVELRISKLCDLIIYLIPEFADEMIHNQLWRNIIIKITYFIKLDNEKITIHEWNRHFCKTQVDLHNHYTCYRFK